MSGSRLWLVAVAGVMGGAILIVAIAIWASALAPLRITCAPTIPADVCAGTVTASLGRGLAPFHPLILSANVEPGPAAATNTAGHRATVRFDLLGVPGSTSVRLFYDMGGHWGAIPDRSAPELAVWALLAAAIVVSFGALVMILSRRVARRRSWTSRRT